MRGILYFLNGTVSMCKLRILFPLTLLLLLFPEARSQKPEARSQKPEARSQKPEASDSTAILESQDFCQTLVDDRLKHVRTSYKSFYKRMLNVHTRGLHNIPSGAVLFIGDSIVQSLVVTAIDPKTINLGIGTDDTIGVLTRLDFYLPALRKASKVVIAVGVNDINWRSKEEVLRTYQCILERIPPGPEITISSILPISAAHHDVFTPQDSKLILVLNQALRELTKKNDRVSFLDHSIHFTVPNTPNLKRNLHVGDGIHLNSQGYELLIASYRENFQQ